MNFIHLHTHSHYSLLDGLPKISELVAAAKEMQMPALALTDHGVMYGVIEFYKACKKEGIKPIIGMEAYVALGEMEEKKARVDDDYYHLTLLASDLTGYMNLMRLNSIAHLEGFYYKPRLDKKILRKYNQGIISLSGCLRGEVPRLILANQKEQAKAAIRDYLEIFGQDNFFLELQYHPESDEQQKVNAVLKELSEGLGVPLVATTDSHYLAPDDREAQDILLCVQTGRLRTDLNRLDMRGMDLSLKPPEVMIEAFKDFNGAIENTLKIAERCNVELALGKWVFPKFDPPDNKTPEEYLRELAEDGMRKKFPAIPSEVYKRMEYELDIINKKGYATYFLVVADYVNWARSQGIIATTRGSAAGSLVSYLIGITTVDPLFFQLPFERFLNLYRPSPPDIDMDFADNRRDEVLSYVREKYGHDKVAQIVTFGTLLARAAVRDVVRVLGLPYSFGDRIAKMIPPGPHGTQMTMEKALEINQELKQMYESNSQVKEMLDIARRIEGCVRHASVHAAGVVIAPDELTNYTPLQREPGGNNIVTQYEMHAIEEAGLLKMDFLGVRNLSILGDAVRIVKKTKGDKIDLTNLPLDDKATYDLLARGDTMGVFQLSGSGMTRYLVDLKPNSINDIMAMVALFRPGPMESIPEYIRRKHNPKLVQYLDPRLKPILEKSYGIITYQDDVLLIAIHLAGYTWEEADKLRKAIGKKILKEMAAQKEKFLNGCVKNGIAQGVAEEIWKQIEPFAAYGFNKSHAASYAIIAHQTAYMKAHFPAEFMTAVLTAESGDNEKVAEIITACRQMGIEVLPPDANESLARFTYINDKQIRFGLLAIKNLGSDIVEAIINERQTGERFASLEDFLSRVKHKNLNKKSLESLIKSGAMDIFSERGILLENLETLLSYHKNVSELDESHQTSLFAALPQDVLKPSLNLKPVVNPLDEETKIKWEKELLGLFISSHPFEKYISLIPKDAIFCGSLSQDDEGAMKKVAGVVISLKRFITKNNETMAVAHLEDNTGSCEVVVFPKLYSLSSGLWQEGAVLSVLGRVAFQERGRRIICEKAEPLTQENQNKQNVTITLRGADSALLQDLRSFFAAHPGKAQVYLNIDASGENKIIKTEFRIQADESNLRLLEQIAGPGAVQLNGG